MELRSPRLESHPALSLDFERMSARTREVLRERLQQAVVLEPRFFTPEEFSRLKALCEVAIPQVGSPINIDLAGDIDTKLAEGRLGKGWRYNDLPPEPQMYREILEALDRSMLETLLRDQKPSWVAHFWEDFLAEVTEIYYSHPLVQASIGSRGMMDDSP